MFWCSKKVKVEEKKPQTVFPPFYSVYDAYYDASAAMTSPAATATATATHEPTPAAYKTAFYNGMEAYKLGLTHDAYLARLESRKTITSQLDQEDVFVKYLRNHVTVSLINSEITGWIRAWIGTCGGNQGTQGATWNGSHYGTYQCCCASCCFGWVGLCDGERSVCRLNDCSLRGIYAILFDFSFCYSSSRFYYIRFYFMAQPLEFERSHSLELKVHLYS